jgi:hypothetical protein
MWPDVDPVARYLSFLGAIEASSSKEFSWTKTKAGYFILLQNSRNGEEFPAAVNMIQNYIILK